MSKWLSVTRIIWADGIFPIDRHIYCTLGQWNRLPGFNEVKDFHQPPYLLIRSPIVTTTAIDHQA
jgi:hypothetical protein